MRALLAPQLASAKILKPYVIIFLKLFAGKQLIISVPLSWNTALYCSVECMVKIESDAQIIRL
jgi:hypothetical protein